MKEISLVGKQGRITGLKTVVDDQDYWNAFRYRWGLSKTDNCCYAHTRITVNGKRKTLLLHRVLLGIDDKNVVVDHIDGNGLNNQRSNLRICTQQQNIYNSRKSCSNKYSKYKGVHLTKYLTWHAEIRKDGKSINLGTYETEIDAAKAYDKKAKELFGEFAHLNFPGRNC